jgi:hypothetical protein
MNLKRSVPSMNVLCPKAMKPLFTCEKERLCPYSEMTAPKSRFFIR